MIPPSWSPCSAKDGLKQATNSRDLADSMKSILNQADRNGTPSPLSPSCLSLLNSDTLGQVTREIDVETLGDGHPVGQELERDDIEKTLETVDGAGDFDSFDLVGWELGLTLVADDDWTASTCDDYRK